MDLNAEETSVLRTLAHFDVLDYPLTLLEIAKFNRLGLAAGQISRLLEALNLRGLISSNHGMYCLKGREAIINSRLLRYRLALPKLKRARRFANLFSYFPWIRAVAIYSSLALKNSRPDSDIDLFFITAAGRAWSARFWLNAFLKFFGLRPAPGKTRDRLCASYLVDEDHLDLSFANFPHDYFYAYGCASFAFQAAEPEVENRFWQANRWIKNILPAWQPTAVQPRRANDYFRFWQKWKEKLLALIPENSYRRWQMKILPAKYQENNDGKKVALDDGIIKLHDNDKRGEYNRLFAENFNRSVHYEKPS